MVCLAVPETEKVHEIPHDLERISLAVAPNMDKSNLGVSLSHWYNLDPDNYDLNTNYALYVMFSLNSKLGWSCPLRVDQVVARKGICVKSSERQSVS